jgi:flagellin
LGGGAASTTFGAAAAVTATSTNVIASTNAFAANATNMRGYVTGMFKSTEVALNSSNGYDVTVNMIDNFGRQQTFKALGTAPANAGTFVLYSTHDPSNNFTLTYNAAVTGITDAATFKSTLDTTLGTTAGSLNGSLSSASADPTSTVNGLTYNTGIVAGSNTPTGEYVLSYVANSNKVHLSSANYSEDVTVSADDAQTVTFKNGVTVSLAAGFDRTAALTQTAFRVDAPGATSLSFQTGEESADTLTANFSSVTGSSLNVASTTIDSVANAQSASLAIKAALQTINSMYSQLGAQQARLEATITNLATTSENLGAAQHNYEDADVAAAIISQQLNTIGSEMANMGVGKALSMNQQLLKLYQQV